MAKSIMPFKLRNNTQDAWLSSLMQPIQTINTTFSELVKKHRYDLSFNGQVIYLEHIINDLFDTTLRRIYITDPTNAPNDNVYLTYIVEGQPPVHTTYVSENEPGLFIEYASESINFVDFIVKIPTSINTPQVINKMRGVINKYKIAGKKYSIENI